MFEQTLSKILKRHRQQDQKVAFQLYKYHINYVSYISYISITNQYHINFFILLSKVIL